MCHGRILPLVVVSWGRTANAVRRLCLTGAIVMGVARERGCRRVGEALRRAEMREPKCALNLPNIIGQTPTVPSRESGSPQSRRPNSPLSRRYGRKPGIASFIGRHIFNRSFRNDVNAGEISLRLQAKCGKTTCRSTHECYGRLVSSQEAA